MAREELKNTNDNADDVNHHHHDRRRRKAAEATSSTRTATRQSSELDDDGASFNQFNEQEFNAFKANENRKKPRVPGADEEYFPGCGRLRYGRCG